MAEATDRDRARSLADLRGMCVDELISEHDRIAPKTGVTLNYFLNELNRRDQDQQTKAILRYTKWITGMTVVITIATVINLVIAICT